MKKVVFILMAVASTTAVYAGLSNANTQSLVQETVWKNPYFKFISASELPASAQATINQYFGGLSNVKKAKIDRYKYEVETRDGFEVEFNFDGSVKSIESDYKSIPFGVLSTLPGNVYSHVSNKYAGWKLLEVEIKSSKIELELEKGRFEAELKFNGSGRLTKEKIDD